MAKHLDTGKVENALKRAARAAVSGNREDRAGQLRLRDASSGRFSGERSDKHREKDNPKK
jgi:hypothetical protein